MFTKFLVIKISKLTQKLLKSIKIYKNCNLIFFSLGLQNFDGKNIKIY